jgi:DNA-binding CsgD family transcriptional regulator
VAESVEGLVGRDEELQRGRRAIIGSRSVLVTSRPAQGRTFFARCLAASVGRPVHLVRADPASRAMPFGALASLVSLPGAPIGDGPDSVSTAARRLAGSTEGDATIIVVDEAQELDDHSALALALATDAGTVLVLVAPQGAVLPPALAALRHTGRLVDVELGPMPDAAVTSLAGQVLGGPVEPVMVRTLMRLTGGSAAAIAETLRFARERGDVKLLGRLWRQTGPLHPPPAVITRVADAVAPLHRTELDALDMVVLATRVPLGVITGLVGERSVEVLETHGFVETHDDDEPDLGPADALVRWVRLAKMTPSRRRRLARILRAEFAEHRVGHPDASGSDLLDASLALRSGDALDGATAIRAARIAKAGGDLELAEELCRSVVRGVPDAGVLIFLAELLTALGRNREAEQLLDGIDVDRPEDAALVAMTRAVNLGFHLDQVDAAMAILGDAIERLDDEPWVAELIGLRGVLELMLGRPRVALEVVEPYLTPPEGRRFVEAATAAGPSLVVIGRHLDAAALAQLAFDERVRLGEQPLLSSSGLHALIRAMGLGEAGCFAEADTLSDFVMAMAATSGEREGEMWAGVIGGRSLLTQGRYTEALRAFEIAAAAATDLNMAPHLRWARGGALLAVAQTGDAAAAQEFLDALDACPPTDLQLMASELERARAWAAIARHDIRAGVERLTGAATTAHLADQPGLEVLALHDLVRVGRTEHAARLVDVAGCVQGELAAVRAAHASALTADDPRGLAAVAARFEELGAVVLAAETANQASWSHRRRGERSAAEHERARALRLRAARPEAATPALEPAPAMAWLTSREREVATLAAGGASSKDIAGRLGVSVRTVDNLLHRTYRKLGLRGRDDLRSARLGDERSEASSP